MASNAAIAAVSTWQYEPALKDDKPVEVIKIVGAQMSAEELTQAELRVDYWPEDPPKGVQ